MEKISGHPREKDRLNKVVELGIGTREDRLNVGRACKQCRAACIQVARRSRARKGPSVVFLPWYPRKAEHRIDPYLWNGRHMMLKPEKHWLLLVGQNLWEMSHKLSG